MALSRLSRLVSVAATGVLVFAAAPASALGGVEPTPSPTASPTPDPTTSTTPSPTTSPTPDPVVVPTTVVLDGPSTAYVGASVPLTVVLSDETGTPVADAQVLLQRRVDGEWRGVETLTTDPEGTATRTVKVQWNPANDVFRAVYEGGDGYGPDTSEELQVFPRKYATRITVAGPSKVVDERRAVLTISWKAADGRTVGKPVLLFRKMKGVWNSGRLVRLGADGFARVKVRPRHDTRWKAVGRAGAWHRGDVSNVHLLDNVPPGVVVRLPRKSPKPTIVLPAQRRAVGAGPNMGISRIPNAVWRDMVGVSWTSRCPVGRGGLRLIRVNYWGFDGYRHRGELVIRADVASRVGNAFAALYRNRVPIRSMYRVDRFGYNRTLRGADDFKSMAADNTSGFNCRGVVNRPRVLSPHAFGRAIDINPWENPYASRYPNSYWRYHRLDSPATWRSSSDLVPRLMRRHGIRWTYGLGDIHHFDA